MENHINEHTDSMYVTNNHEIKTTLAETARWGKFLAIVGFISLGLIVLLGLFMGTFMTSMYGSANMIAALGGIGFFLLYTLIAAIYYYPIYALYRFSVLMKRSLATNDTTQFAEATRYLKNMFKYIGIVTIIMLAMYGLFFLLGMMIAAMT